MYGCEGQEDVWMRRPGRLNKKVKKTVLEGLEDCTRRPGICMRRPGRLYKKVRKTE
jgi:hypothetical protein